MPSAAWPRVQVLIAAILFSTGGVAIKGNSLTDWQVASFRCAIGVIALLILIPDSRRNWSWRLAPVGLCYAGTLILFALASKRTTAANAIFLQYTAPAYLLILGPLILGERLNRSDLGFLLAAASGCVLIFLTPAASNVTAPDPQSGNVIAAFSGLTWALTIAGMRWSGRSSRSRDTATTGVAMGNVIAFLIALPMALPVPMIKASDIAALLYLGIFQIALAYVFLTRALQRVPAFETSTLLTLEPALSPLWAWILLNETPGTLTLWGGAIILSATMLNTWWQHRRHVSPE